MRRTSLAAPRASLGGLGSASTNRQSTSGRPSMAPKRQSMMPGDDRRSRGMSLGGRRSSVMPQGARKVEDPRPLRDKAYMSKSIRKLIVYLSEHGYDRSISSQILTSPTTKDFLAIISFMFANIDPNFKFIGKFEDEIPGVLKLLAYPTSIGRSALTAVGNPTSWPQLLAVLSWLVDLLKYHETVTEQESDGHFDSDDGHTMFVDYLSRAYALFLAGEDDTSALEEEVAFVFDSKNAQLRQQAEQLRAANGDVEKQLQLFSGETPLQRAQSTNRDLRADSAKFEAHIGQLQEHRDKLTDKLQAEEAERDSKHAELAAVLAEVEGHKATVAKQELTPADVARMGAERTHLEQELASLKKQKEAASTEQWDAELAVSKGLDRVHAKAAAASEAALRLAAVAAEARMAPPADDPVSVLPGGGGGGGGVPLPDESRASPGAPPLNCLGTFPPAGGLLSVDPVAARRPALQELKARLSESLLAEQDALLEAETGQTRAADELAAQGEELSELKAALARVEREEAALREQHARELEERHRKAEAIHQKIASSRSGLESSLAGAQGELAALQAEHESFVSMATRSREKMYNQVVGVLDTLLSHKDQMQDQLADLKSHIAQRAAQLEPLLV
uniref:Kinetochore protein NDC80 n=1 Tax=Emiliania huxleyi TaxID=2903 RepID=A0A7S3W4X4_EMIHU